MEEVVKTPIKDAWGEKYGTRPVQVVLYREEREFIKECAFDAKQALYRRIENLKKQNSIVHTITISQLQRRIDMLDNIRDKMYMNI